MDECYLRLANAIVIQAVKDYRAALQTQKKKPNSLEAKSKVNSLEKFFRSGWYCMLTDLDGEMMIQKIKEMEGASV